MYKLNHQNKLIYNPIGSRRFYSSKPINSLSIKPIPILTFKELDNKYYISLFRESASSWFK